MTNKVFTGTTSIQDHIKQLGIDGWIPHDARRDMMKPEEVQPKQSLEMRKLKREAGLE